MARNNDGYTGMLILATVAMSIGVLALIIEASEYGWEQKAASGAKATVPALPRTAMVDTNAPTNGPQSPKPLIPSPVIVQSKPDAPAPAAVDSKPVVATETKPAVQPQPPVVEGPIPSPLVIPNRTQVRPALSLPTSTPTIPGGAKTEPVKQAEPAAAPGEPGDPIPSPIKFPRR